MIDKCWPKGSALLPKPTSKRWVTGKSIFIATVWMKNQDHCVASKDLKGFYPGNTFFQQTLFPSICQFTDDHNPVTNLVMRRFLLGDQDYLKLDNYLFKHAEDDELLTGKLVSIDFGMSFYNRFSSPGTVPLMNLARNFYVLQNYTGFSIEVRRQY